MRGALCVITTAVKRGAVVTSLLPETRLQLLSASPLCSPSLCQSLNVKEMESYIRNPVDLSFLFSVFHSMSQSVCCCYKNRLLTEQTVQHSKFVGLVALETEKPRSGVCLMNKSQERKKKSWSSGTVS